MPTKLAVVNGRWRLDRRLGQGADAEVWLATDLAHDRACALKALAHGDPAAEARLRREFAVLAEVDHPGLVSVGELGRAESGPLARGQLFFTCEVVDGASPAEALEGLAAEPRARRLIGFAAELAAALDALHRRGLVHHDVKPDNLRVDRAGRIRLLDLGLAAARGSVGARGTPAYLAPEALDGGGDARVDLYALGATLFELWSGAPPFPSATLGELARAVLAAPSAPALPPRDGEPAPPDLARLVGRLLARDPAKRPSSARALVDEARRAGAALDKIVLPPRDQPPPMVGPAMVGRTAPLSALAAALDAFLDGAGPPLLRIVGPPGSGRSRLVDEALRAASLRAASRQGALVVCGPDARAALAALGVRVAAGEPERARAVAVAAAAAALAARPAVLRLDRASDPLARALIAAAAAGGMRPSLAVVELDPDDASGAGAETIVLGALAEADGVALVRSMRDDLGAAFARAVHRAAGGLPGAATAIALAVADGQLAPTADSVAALAGGSLVGWLGPRVDRLTEASRAAAEALAVLAEPALAEAVARVADLRPDQALRALAEARAAGLAVADDDGRFALPTAAHREALAGPLSAPRRRLLHRRALAEAGGPEATARHLAALDDPGAGPALLAAGDAARERLDLAAAASFLRAAVDRRAGVAASLQLSEVLAAAGDYPGALGALEGIAGADAALLAARALQRSGSDEAAERRLRAALDPPPADPARAAALRGLLGRVLIARGRPEEALAVCAAPLPDGVDAAAPLEAAGLAALQLGRPDEAARCFTDAEARARAAGDAGRLGRAQLCLGLVAQRQGDLPAAAHAYRGALAAAIEAGDVHEAAIYRQNLGVVLREQCDLGAALVATEEAARDLGRLGKRVERTTALFNLANLLASLGDIDGAERARAEAASLAAALRDERLCAAACALEGDLERRRGRPAQAIPRYLEAERRAAPAGDHDGAGWARLARAEALIDLGRVVEARPLLAGEPDGGALAEARTITLLRAQLAAGEAPSREAIAEVERAAAGARATHRRETAFRAEVTLARAFAWTGELAPTRAALARAKTLWEEIRMRTPESYRERLEADPDARRLRALVDAEGAAPAEGGAARPRADDARLRRLVAINKRLASELRLGPLLELIIDAVIELTRAERGFVLLAGRPGPDGAVGPLAVRVARNFDQQTIEAGELVEAESPDAATPEPAATDGKRRRHPRPARAGTGEFALSRSIAERAARERSPVVTLDAAGDQRFEAARSVSDLKLRSVLAAPLIARGRVVGCLYVDHRLRAGAFDDDDVALVLDFADQAAIAVENARLLEENQRREREVAGLAAELEREVASQKLELGSLHTELRQSRAALEVRYDYRNLVGRTPRMIELFRLLDRVTDTALPVVLYGESGTGKELVARALHHNGPRAQRPFVSENCAAIPETLLEAALFGHARGAFTGATDERRGLFEIADGGTLFLDEVGEMSPAMQSKLLRVLQDGEFRRVGGERARRADVRILAASNRDLGKLVEEGRFREDLFYRLNVVRVALPALRERREDIPLLVEHFLKKHAAEANRPPKRIARAALARLCGYRWPGNVRELENEVMRAAALSADSIALEDLSPQVAAGEEASLASPDDLTLRARVERLERTLLGEALGRSGGNQSRAARMLGLSRFGLQKKLKRYRLERT